MHKIQSNGATVDFKFTEGNASLLIPATVVDAYWLNAVQGELVNIVEYAGLTLEPANADDALQLLQAVQILIAGGGLASPINDSIANNQASAADVAGFPQFDKTIYKAIAFDFVADRRTDTNHAMEMGTQFILWDGETNAWVYSIQSQFDDAGLDFQATLVSGTNYKLQYKTDNLTGASYAGSVRITNIRKIKV